MLGPGLNIRRNPLNGRNFEYFSEDPLITGSFAAAAVRGINLSGSSATIKHFACNNQEKERSLVDAIISERALREIYLRGFELAVKTGGANSVMTSYNPINGHWAASNYDLCTTVLREEWGFEGIVMTDWWAKMNDCVTGGKEDKTNTNFMVRAQNDVYMVINNNGAEINSGNDNTMESLKNGTLTVGELQRSARNICQFLMNSPVFQRKQEFNEPITNLVPVVQCEQVQVHDLEENNRVKPSKSQSVWMQTKQAGDYRIIVNIMSPESNLAQTTVNVVINGEVMTTVTTNGTDGNWITQKLNKVSLQPGFYEMKLEVVKPGMEIDWVEFKEM